MSKNVELGSVRGESLKAEGLLCRLVAIPSVNPMGRVEMPPECGEARIANFLAELLESWGLAIWRQPVDPGRENIVAVETDISGPQESHSAVSKNQDDRALLVFSAHMDTVPPSPEMARPFDPCVIGGRLYGRGACDVKGGMAAILLALQRLLSQPKQTGVRLGVAFTVNEEFGFSGSQALARLMGTGGQKSVSGDAGPPFDFHPAAVVVAEPTSLNVIVEHKGVVRWRCHARGKAAHSAFPDRGINAIYQMAHVLRAIEEYGDQLAQKRAVGRSGKPSVSVGTITGGVSVNTVPDSCTIEIDRRLAPNESPTDAREELIRWIEERTGLREGIEHEEPSMVGLPLPDQSNQSIARQLAHLAEQIAGRGEMLGAPYATDAAFFVAAGIPTIVFGPGAIEQAHTADEWISLEEVETAAEILFHLGRGFRG